ncbi:MAG: hypothetical protein GY811_29565 [Myxococcales bacterium]|nr:hypothetical protein [Myxococcales bacterium]
MIRPAVLSFALGLFLSFAPTGASAELEPPNEEVRKLPSTLSIGTPDGWGVLEGLSNTVSQSVSETNFFGKEEPFSSGAIAYGRANRGVVYVTWVISLRSQPVAAESVRLAFDELHQSPSLANHDPGSTQEVSYRERIFDGVAELRFEWAHMDNGTVNIVRALGWKDANARVHLALAECVLQSESIAESRPLCETSLDSLVLTKESNHETLASLPEPKTLGQMAPADFTVPKLKTSEVLPSDSLGAAPAQMGEVLYQGRPKSKEDNNNRFVIAIGVLLLGIAFWLTTRSTPGAAEDKEEGESDERSEDTTEEEPEDSNDENIRDFGHDDEEQS